MQSCFVRSVGGLGGSAALQVGGCRARQEPPIWGDAAGNHAGIGRLAEADAHVEPIGGQRRWVGTDNCSCTYRSAEGWRTKSEISGAMWLRPKPRVAFTRSRPWGVACMSLNQLLHVVDLGQDAARML